MEREPTSHPSNIKTDAPPPRFVANSSQMTYFAKLRSLKKIPVLNPPKMVSWTSTKLAVVIWRIYTFEPKLEV